MSLRSILQEGAPGDDPALLEVGTYYAEGAQ
jgi:hypothetical protein